MKKTKDGGGGGDTSHGKSYEGDGGEQEFMYRDDVKMIVIFLVCGIQLTSSISILEVINLVQSVALWCSVV